MGALAVCLLLLQGPTPPRNPVQEAVGYLLAHQGTDGSWGGAPSGCACRKTTVGGDLESTAWAILALERVGYTELSQDLVNGRRSGQAVRSGLEWLVSRQDKEGAFDRADAAVNALAALALIEHYGFTELRKEAAEKAYAWVDREEVQDVRARIRQGMVLYSGRLSDLGTGHQAKLARSAEALAKDKGDLARWGSLLSGSAGWRLRFMPFRAADGGSAKSDPGRGRPFGIGSGRPRCAPRRRTIPVAICGPVLLRGGDGGMGAIAAWLLLLQAEPPRRNPVLEGLTYLAAHQRADGSWGGAPSGCTCRAPTRDGDLESTAWALLAFQGAGYIERSPDDLNGHKFGLVVRSGLEWLVSRQDKEGAFDRDHPAANAIAALVLTETTVMAALRKEAAEKAYAWVEKAQIHDVVGRIRQGMVLQSGKLAEIGTQHEAKILALAEGLAKEEGDPARWGSLLLKGFALHGKREKPSMKLEIGDPLKFPVEALNLFAGASFMLGREDRWHEWFKGLKDVLLPLQREGKDGCEAGSWDGGTLRERVRVTALRCLTIQHYRCWYCRNIFRGK